ncbi:hypothetical protein [Echinicola shivajiensis]|uniref:hypothetical protein n=1 Tax=Echinicola shivajiensis TaxID=1035916 RepID=UPI001BFCCE8F|nr:hypothetical protein [Echinicola shivajiensis]
MSQIAYLGVILSSLIGSFIYYFYQKPAYRTAHKILLFTLAFVFFLEAAGYFTSSKGINNVLLYNICGTYLQSFLLVSYLQLLEVNRKFKQRTNLVFGGLYIWGIINSVYLQPIDKVFQYYSLVPFGLFILFLAGRFLYQVIKLRTYSDSNLVAVPHFWIVTVLIFFYIEVILLFGVNHFFPGIDYVVLKPWLGLNRVFAGLMYLTFSISFYTPFLFVDRKFN